MKRLFFDTETASFQGPIIQIAWQLYDDRELINERVDYLRHPFEYEMNQEAYKVHGISPLTIAALGVDADVVMYEFWILYLDCDKMIAHNTAFDWEMLSLGQPDKYTRGQDDRCFCTMTDKDIKEYVGATNKNGAPKQPSMSELYRKCFNTEIENAHDALGDVKALASSYFYLLDSGIIK